MRSQFPKLILLPILLLLAAFAIFLIQMAPVPVQGFDAQRAYQNVKDQVAFGPRLPGSEAHQRTIDWISGELRRAGWQVEIQQATRLGHPIRNIIAKRGSSAPWIILGAHFDTRLVADRDPDPAKRTQPVPGANDGASGVAVLLEIARVLPASSSGQVWLVFFDAEDQGNLPGWDWILGSRVFAESLTTKPDAVVVLDMVGDAQLNIHPELASNAALNLYIWNIAAQLHYQQYFIPTSKYNILDDHVPFLEAGIKAVDIIDIDYTAWHTTGDTPDKVSPESLKIVGETMLKWLEKPFPLP